MTLGPCYALGRSARAAQGLTVGRGGGGGPRSSTLRRWAPRKREGAREERKRGVDKDKELILQQIEADKSDRKDKSWR